MERIAGDEDISSVLRFAENEKRRVGAGADKFKIQEVIPKMGVPNVKGLF